MLCQHWCTHGMALSRRGDADEQAVQGNHQTPDQDALTLSRPKVQMGAGRRPTSSVICR